MQPGRQASGIHVSTLSSEAREASQGPAVCLQRGVLPAVCDPPSRRLEMVILVRGRSPTRPEMTSTSPAQLNLTVRTEPVRLVLTTG